ncbi:D-amino-acid transaminase [Cytobacillus massiliigabonensis]|uniref:D-amino-acid transaminase n=1 Tax=Cytobacillus massiliigabonensis TaxID=1871011 RepID=UPI000C863330|nr:D-amino-acid transaminase [Cytobacillus massiliigabonensis]
MFSAYFNGAFVTCDEPVIPIDERGHQFGDGVYEVIRVYNGQPFMLDEHIERLYQSAAAIKLCVDSDQDTLKDSIWNLIHKSGLSSLDLYVQITRGIAPRNHLFPERPVSISMTAKPFRHISSVGEKGAGVTLHPDERWENCYIKSLNLLPNILAKQTAHEKGFLEAVLVRNGKVTEGTSSNVFIVQDSSIITTPLSKHILSGITRMAVKSIAEDAGIPLIERHFSPEEMIQSDELFITSTTLEIMPIYWVDNHLISEGKKGTVTRVIQELFDRRK